MMITKEEILNALPEIGEVENPQWREACLAVWAEAAGMSCWERLADAPNNLDVPEDSLVRHTRGVYAGAFALAEAMQKSQNVDINRDKLRVICLLHDVCKLVELERDQRLSQKQARRRVPPRVFQLPPVHEARPAGRHRRRHSFAQPVH